MNTTIILPIIIIVLICGFIYIQSAEVDNNTGGITSCYIPSGISFSDTTGSGTYAGECYYGE